MSQLEVKLSVKLSEAVWVQTVYWRVYFVVFLHLVCLGSRCSSPRRSDLLEVIRDKLLPSLTDCIMLNNVCSAAEFKQNDHLMPLMFVCHT